MRLDDRGENEKGKKGQSKADSNKKERRGNRRHSAREKRKQNKFFLGQRPRRRANGILATGASVSQLALLIALCN